MNKKRFLVLNFFFSFLTIGVYYSAAVSPSDFWPAGFIALFIPFVLLLHAFIALIWICISPWYAGISITTLLLGLRFLQSSFSLHIGNVPDDGLQILSYNVRVFNSYNHLRSDKKYTSSDKMIRFIARSGAQLVCLQEFYQDKKSPVFNITKRLKTQYPHFYISNEFKNVYGHQFGLAIYSKFKIWDFGVITFDKRTKNHCIWVDIIYKKEKLRIYNLHLQSMSINENDLVNDKWEERNLIKNFLKYKHGVVSRAAQVSTILQHIHNCKSNVILCADLNDTPYSYAYTSFTNILKNAFEEGGTGIGATYNGKLPYLRIDNQFVSPEIEVKYFKVHTDVSYSDHFPVSAIYDFK